MMINKRLISTIGRSKKYIAGNVIVQWFSMIFNIVMIFSIANLLGKLAEKSVESGDMIFTICAAVIAVAVRFVCSRLQSKFSFLASKTVKKTLREMIYKKLLRLGSGYTEGTSTAEAVQVSVEGVDQLETYFGSYLPQFFYAMIAPLTLFAVLAFVSIKAAAVLLICVPLIPVVIVVIQKIAKRLLSKYWGQYTQLGDTFLENLQGLTTLKIYQADEFKNKKMNEESEKFRKITMKVLTMQLNSITVMDLVAYGGASLGIIMAASEFNAGNIGFAGCFAIILLSADFFIPMRQLGSFFHVAMNGMAASDKIFRLIDLPEPEQKSGEISPDNCGITIKDLRYSYEENREVLHGIDIEIPEHSFTAIVGESGCGKSTIAAVLMGRNRGYNGSVKIGGTELSEISEESLMQNVTYIGHNSYLFKGTVRDNLLMGDPNADDKALWEVLEKTNLADFLRSENGLDTALSENAANLSGGQRQRLALARALLHDSPIYIFDEATSNIDADSENEIMEQITRLAETKTVILISHRLANCVYSDTIYAMENGAVIERGTHEKLLENGDLYAKLWNAQQRLENLGREAV
ncbi:MAG: ABC transporter ATP-binding protein/permease [Oscillospiraceae bacterium]|nr:ABC transporter ATP-binding protein/permease [Oscillospiraceae bacterium]